MVIINKQHERSPHAAAGAPTSLDPALRESSQLIGCSRSARFGRWCRANRSWIFISCAAFAFLATLLGVAAKKRCRSSQALPEPPRRTFADTDEEEPLADEVAQSSSSSSGAADAYATPTTQQSIHAIIQNKDRIELESCLGDLTGGWHDDFSQSTATIQYNLMSRDPKGGGPTQYLSTTRYLYLPDVQKLLYFMTDNDNKLRYDKTFVRIEQLEVNTDTGIEFWHTIKRYPRPIGYREYVLASKVWERQADQSFFCVTKACVHPKAPKPQHTRVVDYLSGWKISKVGESDCEIKVFHQEDIKSVFDVFKSMLTDKIWEYVQETATHLKDYKKENYKPKDGRNAVTLAEKI